MSKLFLIKFLISALKIFVSISFLFFKILNFWAPAFLKYQLAVKSGKYDHRIMTTMIIACWWIKKRHADMVGTRNWKKIIIFIILYYRTRNAAGMHIEPVTPWLTRVNTNALGDYAATWIYDLSVIMGVRLSQNIT